MRQTTLMMFLLAVFPSFAGGSEVEDGPDSCVNLCDETLSCETVCDDLDGQAITCGQFGWCETCDEVCAKDPLPCRSTCSDSGQLTTCENFVGDPEACLDPCEDVCQGGTCRRSCDLPNGSTTTCTEFAFGTGDLDNDGMQDTMERKLAERFYPGLNMHSGTYEGTTHGSFGQYYGGGEHTRTNLAARLPFVVREVHAFVDAATGVTWCGDEVHCYEILYGLAYSWDLGDDLGGCDHPGDTELVGVLVTHSDPTTPMDSWGTPWGAAQHDPTQWRRVRTFAAAHMCDSGDSSEFRTHLTGAVPGAFGYDELWVAEGKNATYFSQSDCNSGGTLSADDCSDHREWAPRAVGLDRLQNVGDDGCCQTYFRHTIASPASDPEYLPYGLHDVWLDGEFGEATPWFKKLRDGTVGWGSETVECWNSLPDDPAEVCPTAEHPTVNDCHHAEDLCGGTCVPLNQDEANCGACGNVCGANQQCAGGFCETCPAGHTLCNGSCVDLLSSEQHCGACEQACNGSQSCLEGTCDACPSGEVLCGGECVDLDWNDSHCGGCSDGCGTDETCTMGFCENTRL